MSKSRVIIIGALGLVIVFFALIFLGVIPGLKGPPPDRNKVKLNFWGVFDEPGIMGEVLSSIPGFEVSYRVFDPQTYEAELINALAAGRGPDVFMIHSTWSPKHADKLSPASAEQIPISSLQALYPTVVEQDFAPDGFIYALPLYIDTLALFYNRDIFDSVAVAGPPESWTDFQNLIPKLRQLDSSGKLLRAAAAIGGSAQNINRAQDLLSALMLQAGVPMVSKDFSRAVFAEDGREPLAFYTKFANPAGPYYTWNDGFQNSIDSFADESTVMILNYAYQIANIKAKNPFLKFAVAPLPQPSGAAKVVNFANYWGVAVSNRYPNPLAAWNFVIALAADPKVAELYAEKTGRLPALRSLIEKNLNGSLAVFGKQALSARSWPQIDNNEVDRIFSEMIDKVISGRADLDRALREAESAVTELMARRKNF